MHFLIKTSVLSLAATSLLTIVEAAGARQGGDVTVTIKAKSKPADLPTLLVLCDVGCNWKLDGEDKGHIEAGGSAKVKIESGEHMVEAATEDGMDQVKQPSTVKPTGQTMVSIELWPIRYARLVVERKAKEEEVRDEAAKEQEARDLAASQEKERMGREQIARDKSAGVWTDKATGLTWTAKDNGDESVTTQKQASQYDLTWLQAADYCQSLRLEGHSDWRLPTLEELRGISSSEGHPGHCCGMSHEILNDWRVKGGLQLTGYEWSSTPGPGSKDAWYFNFFIIGSAGSNHRNEHAPWMRALCVRRSDD